MSYDKDAVWVTTGGKEISVGSMGTQLCVNVLRHYSNAERIGTRRHHPLMAIARRIRSTLRVSQRIANWINDIEDKIIEEKGLLWELGKKKSIFETGVESIAPVPNINFTTSEDIDKIQDLINKSVRRKLDRAAGKEESKLEALFDEYKSAQQETDDMKNMFLCIVLEDSKNDDGEVTHTIELVDEHILCKSRSVAEKIAISKAMEATANDVSDFEVAAEWEEGLRVSVTQLT